MQKFNNTILPEITKRLVVIVAGGGSGLGREVCNSFSALGASVYSLQRRLSSTRWHCICCDVTNEHDVTRAVDDILLNEGRIHLVINCAAIYEDTELLDSDSVKILRNVMETNFFGAVNVIFKVLPYLVIAKHGVIVNVVSSWAWLDSPSQKGMAYKSSKIALESLGITLNSNLDGSGVRVINYAPKQLATKLTKFQGEDPFEASLEIVNIALRSILGGLNGSNSQSARRS